MPLAQPISSIDEQQNSLVKRPIKEMTLQGTSKTELKISEKDEAYDIYKKVLAIDPKNKTANRQIKNIDKIFERFYSKRPEKLGEHSGLGLNIVKNIVELHGGSIIASNRLGNKKGARFEILLPILNK